MIIERLDLRAFGRFTDISLDLSAGPHRFHIIYGPNESGKSTSLRAITSLLYGMTSRTSDNFVHEHKKMRVGGKLIGEHGDMLECFRRRGNKDTLRDADDKDAIPEAKMTEMLSGVDQETFSHRFGLSHDELVQGGAQIVEGDGDLGSILFAAGAGVSRLREIQSQLDVLCRKLFIPGGKNGTINQAIRTLTDKKKELREAQIPPADFDQQKQRLEQKRTAADKLREQIKEMVVDLSRLQALQKSLPLIPKWNSINASLSEIAKTPLLDDAFTDRRRSVETDREIAISQQASLKTQLEQLRQQREVLDEDSPVLQREAEIEALLKKLGAREQADEDAGNLERTRANYERRMLELLGELQVEIDLADDGDTATKIDEAVTKLRLGDPVRAHVNELARKYELLVGQRDDAAEEVDAITHRIADLLQQIDIHGDPVDPDSLNQLIDSIGNPDTLLESLTAQRADAERAKRACDVIHRRLTGFDGSVKQAAELELPPAMSIAQLTTQIDDAASELQTAKSKLDPLIAKREEVSRRLTTQQSGQPLPTLESLEQARQTRDKRLADLSGDKTASKEAWAELRDLISVADQIGDTIRLHHEQVSRRAMDKATLDALSDEIQKVESKIAAATEACAVAQRQWRSMWELTGVVADNPPRMQQWVTDHQQLVQQVDQWDEERRRLSETQARIQSASARLRSSIGAVSLAKAGVADDAAPSGDSLFAQEDSQVDLISLYEDALAVRRKLADAKIKHRDLETRLVDLRQNLPDAQSRLQSRQRQLDAWQSDWDSATSSFAANVDRTPTVVLEMVSQIGDLCHQKRERDILAKRIHSISVDEASYREKVLQLAKAVGMESSESAETHSIVRELIGQLRKEQASLSKRATIDQQMQETEQQLASATQHQSQCDIGLAKLCAEAMCDDAAQLVETERRSRQRRELETAQENLQEQLRLLAGKETLEVFVGKAEEQEPGLLDIEIEQCQHRVDDLNERLAEAQREVGALKHELERIDGGDRAAELNQSIQLLAGDLNRDAEEYARLRVAAMILRQSIDHYRNENQGPVLKYAQEIFSGLTCGEYHGLRVDYDAKGKLTLFGVRDPKDTDGVPANVMSTGTADALYLSLRLASLRHQMSHGAKIPLIVDDCLVQLDDVRAGAALSALSALSTETQVILFTHHQHLLDLANATLKPGEFHVQSLA